jgi:RNA polymerase sigma factor (TIGR02999 family)
LEDAIRLYYNDLRAMARHAMALERRNHTLQPTELVHDLVRELNQQGRLSFNDRRHVFAYFRQAFSHMLADYARTRSAKKRGGSWTRVSLGQVRDVSSRDDLEASIEMHLVLERLHESHPRVADIVLMRYFLGYLESEIAAKLGISERTVRNDCRFAYAWLRRELAANASSGDVPPFSTATASDSQPT